MTQLRQLWARALPEVPGEYFEELESIDHTRARIALLYCAILYPTFFALDLIAYPAQALIFGLIRGSVMTFALAGLFLPMRFQRSTHAVACVVTLLAMLGIALMTGLTEGFASNYIIGIIICFLALTALQLAQPIVMILFMMGVTTAYFALNAWLGPSPTLANVMSALFFLNGAMIFCAVGAIALEQQRRSLFLARLQLAAAFDEVAASRAELASRNLTLEEEVERRARIIEEQQGQIAQAARLEALGTLAGGVAHDFNNLLMVIQGNLDLVVKQQELDPDQVPAMRTIAHCVRSGAELSRQLLGFARGGRYQAQPSELNSLVQRTLEIFWRTHKGLLLETSFADGLPPVEVDRGQIEQVLLNVLNNAAQAMPHGGEIRVQTSRPTSPGAGSGEWVRVSISDDGVGMNEETRARIFEPFFSTKEHDRGTGLGLASAYGIIQNHGGSIQVESQLGQGSTFHIDLPVTDIEAEAPSASPRRETESARGDGRILLIDDEELVRDTQAEMLRSLGYSVLTASGSDEALRLFGSRGEDIDLVVLDMVMSGVDGSELFQKLRERNPSMPVIIASGYTEEGAAAPILSLRGTRFLQKPFPIQTLASAVVDSLGAPGLEKYA